MTAVKRTKGTRGPKSRTFPNLNVTKTAESLGITKSHLSKLLAGTCRPSLRTAQLLANVLGIPIAEVGKLYRDDLVRCPNPRCGRRWKPEDRDKLKQHLRVCKYAKSKGK